MKGPNSQPIVIQLTLLYFINQLKSLFIELIANISPLRFYASSFSIPIFSDLVLLFTPNIYFEYLLIILYSPLILIKSINLIRFFHNILLTIHLSIALYSDNLIGLSQACSVQYSNFALISLFLIHVKLIIILIFRFR